jgi:hypothetical protein
MGVVLLRRQQHPKETEEEQLPNYLSVFWCGRFSSNRCCTLTPMAVQQGGDYYVCIVPISDEKRL